MAENKTKATSNAVGSYIESISDETRKADCKALVALMSKASKLPAVMWGTSIVGFGTHRYPLAGGKVGEICAVGFSPRKGDISIYGVAGGSGEAEVLGKLGKHKTGKGCLYVNRLADIDLKVLETLVKGAIKAKHVPQPGAKSAA